MRSLSKLVRFKTNTFHMLETYLIPLTPNPEPYVLNLNPYILNRKP